MDNATPQQAFASEEMAEHLAAAMAAGFEFVKFTLPVGAVLGGLRHLGGGVFVGQIPPLNEPVDYRARLGTPPAVFEVPVESGGDLPVELCADPMPRLSGGVRSVAMMHAALSVTGADGKAVLRNLRTGEPMEHEVQS